MERTRVGVAVIVFVGIGVAVATGKVCDGIAEAVGFPVGEGVKVGNDVGTNDVEVGNGVKVKKLNKPVGVLCVPSIGEGTGLGGGVDASRTRNKRIKVEQAQHNTNRNKAGRRILPHCPCSR
jgi:hypothetical protein